MPIQKQVVPIPFAGGLDTKSDPLQVVAGKLLALQNGIFSQTGLISRRWGYTALGKGVIKFTAPIAQAQAIQHFNNELLLFDGQAGYSYIPAENAWSFRSTMFPISQTNQTIIANPYQQLSPDHARLGGIDVFAWEDSRGGIRYSVFDVASGAIILRDAVVTSTTAAGRCKVLPLTTQGLIGIFYDNGSGAIALSTINPSTPTTITVAGFTIPTANTSPTYYDAAVSPNGTIYVFGWILNGSNQANKVFVVNSALTGLSASGIVDTSTGSATKIPGSIGVATDSSNQAWLMWCIGLTSFVIVINASISTILTLQTLPAAPAGSGNPVAICGVTGTQFGVNTLFFFHDYSAGSSFSYQHIMLAGSISITGSIAAGGAYFGCGIASKPYLVGTTGPFTSSGLPILVPFLNVAFQTNQQASYFTMGFPTAAGLSTGPASGFVVSKVQYGNGGGYLNNSDYMVPECQNLGNSVYGYANLVKGIPNTEAGLILSLLGVNFTTLNTAASSFQSAPIANNLYTAGGILQRYDGTSWVECGFNVYPEEVTLTPSGSGGFIAAGTYGYCCTFEYEDQQGNNEISTPTSVQFCTTTGSTSSVAVTIPTLILTNKNGVKLVVYRTTNAGTLLYRVSSAILPTYNSTAVSTITFTDSLADASIQSNGLLYTQPLAVGANPILPNIAPPACSIATTYANRLWIAGLDNPNAIWYSQAAIPGSPMQFCAALNVLIDPDGGPITGLVRNYNNLFIFKQTSVFYITGVGPDATGAQNDLSAPVQIPTGGIGCSNVNSIAVTPMGIFFQANTGGIYLLDNTGTCAYKGAPVEAFKGLIVTSTVVLPNQWLVFTTTSGTALVYDTLYDQWSTFSNHPAVDGDIYIGDGDLYCYVTSSGQVMLQTPSTFTDNGTAIPFSLTTAWFNVAALQGYQRLYHVYLLGQYISPHTLNIVGHSDYDTTSTPVTATIPVTTAPTNPSNYQFRLDVLKKCESFQLVLSDSQSNPGGAGFSLSGLSLVVGVKTGGNKNLPALRQFGVS